jgi:LmbE family N-acetylglucosaminyl deacetylase
MHERTHKLAWIAPLIISLLLLSSVFILGDPERNVTALQPAQYAMPIPANRGAGALWQTLLKLHTRASLLMVTAHPDDEDGGLLTYESRGQGARVTLLTLNRGEGGANVMSPDYFDALGLVRTQELLAADRYYGVHQYWTHMIDYGFSKTKEECLSKWGHDRVLADVVRVVRMTRPLVITSVFVGGPTDGHGNHQVAGETAQEAFKDAGDPKMFPDQIRAGLRPWTPLKDYARVPFFLNEGEVNKKGVYDYANHKWTPAGVYDYVHKRWEPGAVKANVEIPEGEYDPAFGLSFVQLSREGLGMQKSQNGGAFIPEAGQEMSPYHRFGSRVKSPEKEKSFFDGIDVSLNGIADLAQGGDSTFLKQGLAQINSRVEEAMRVFSAQQPDRVAPDLAVGLKETRALIQRVESSQLSDDSKYNVLHELRVKENQFNEALCDALEISMQATVAPEHPPTGIFARFFGTPPSFQVAIPGQQFWVKVHVADQSPATVQVNRVSLAPSDGKAWMIVPENAAPATLANDKTQDVRFKVTVPDDAALTKPYFSRPDIEQAYYNILEPKYLNLPLAPYPLAAWVGMTYQGVPFRDGEIVQSVERVTGRGTVLDPLTVGPAISVWIAPHAGIAPLDARSFQLHAIVHSNVKGPATGTLKLDLPTGWRSEPATADFSMKRDGEDQPVTFSVFPRNLAPTAYSITAVASYGGREYRQGYRTVGYPGLRPYDLYRPATYRTTGVNVKVASGLNVGYIMGSGDDVPESLENLGIHVHLLTNADLAGGDLSKYNIILMGVRTYAVRQDLITYNGRILDYVKNGGVVMVQYNTPEFDHNYGPYPYTMTNDPEEVTDETSKVEILDPSNPVFNWPNKITESDFKGWMEERGSKFMKSWNPHYEALLETHDPGQAPQKGGLLYARYGKGIYIYNAYAFYRELPAGVPGAYRIFANMVSLPRNPEVK